MDAFIASRKKMFDGQNSSAAHAITLNMNPKNHNIEILVFKPETDLVSAMPGTGMKTAFADKPIMALTTQNGTHVQIVDDNGNRNIMGAALAIADAMEEQFGIGIGDNLSAITKLPESDRTMKFMFGCDGTGKEPKYNVICKLIFVDSPLQFAAADREYVMNVGATQQLAIPIGGTAGDLVWESANPSIAMVDRNGEVTAVKGGTTSIMVYPYTLLGGFPEEIKAKAAQVKITVMSDALTYGYNETDLQPLKFGELGDPLMAAIDLPVEGDDSALYIKMPDTDKKTEVVLRNSTGTYVFAPDVTLKDALIKLPAVLLRDDYSQKSNYEITINIGGAIYTIEFKSTSGVVSEAPTVDPSVLIGEYVLDGKYVAVKKRDGQIKASLPGDTGWGNVNVADGEVVLDAQSNVIYRTVKMGYSTNAQIKYSADEGTLTVMKNGIVGGIQVGEVYTKIADGALEFGTCADCYVATSGANFGLCTAVTINDVCQSVKTHYTLCTAEDLANCTDEAHVYKCTEPGTWGPTCGALRTHSGKCPSEKYHKPA